MTKIDNMIIVIGKTTLHHSLSCAIFFITKGRTVDAAVGGTVTVSAAVALTIC